MFIIQLLLLCLFIFFLTTTTTISAINIENNIQLNLQQKLLLRNEQQQQESGSNNNDNTNNQQLTTTTTNHQSSRGTPLPTSTPNICSGVAAGGKPNVQTDVYYVLQFTHGSITRFMSRGDVSYSGQALFDTGIPFKELDTSDYANLDIHFRFEPVIGGYGGYRIINGKSGQYITYAKASPTSNTLILVSTIFNNDPNVITDFSISNCDANGYVQINLNILYNGYIRFHTSGWQFTVSGTSTPVQFRIYEIPSFYPPDVTNPISQPLIANEASKYIAAAAIIMKSGLNTLKTKISYQSWTIVAGQIVNKFGKVASVASVGLGILSAALQIALDFTQESIDDKLVKFESRIMEKVVNVVNDAIVKNNMRVAANFFDTARSDLNQQAMNRKKMHLTNFDPNELDDDADYIIGVTNTINQGLDTIKPEGLSKFTYDDTARQNILNTYFDNWGTDKNVVLIQQAYLLYVSGVMDLISAMAEAVILKSFAQTSVSCNDLIWIVVGLGPEVQKQGFYLQQMASFLYNRRVKGFQVVKNPGQYTGWNGYDTFGGTRTLIYYTGLDYKQDDVNNAINKRKNEILFDMNTYSYRYTTVKSSIDAYIAQTWQLCTDLRTTPDFRASYIDYWSSVNYVV
jgi:hypothetical protein